MTAAKVNRKHSETKRIHSPARGSAPRVRALAATDGPLPNPPEPPRPDDDARAERGREIARRLAQLRREHGLSQDALGAIVGASQATVSRWEEPSTPSAPSALEVAELAAHFGIDVGWLTASQAHRTALPIGDAVLDRALLDAFDAAETPDALRALLDGDMSFGTIWVQIPEGAELTPVPDAIRRVRSVDRTIRQRHPSLWQEWARLVLG